MPVCFRVSQNQDRLKSLLEVLGILLSQASLVIALGFLEKALGKTSCFHLWPIYRTLPQRDPFILLEKDVEFVMWFRFEN
jgi:hypothetical protein